jgi:5-methylcytosine-specific restriction protein B
MIVPGSTQLYAAARRVFDVGLAADDSVFTPGRRVWMVQAAEDLDRRFVQAPEVGPARFVEKLSRQLAGAPQETVQLAAELTYLYLLPPNDIGIAAKRRLLADVLALAPEPPTVPPDLDAALDGGFARAGTAYHTQRDRQLAWLVRFVQAWKALPPSRQRDSLADPWAFRQVADSVPIGSAYSQRNALLHLAFPDTFEPIVSRQHKKAILAGFADEIPAPTGDEDRDLLALRQSLEGRTGEPVFFYRGSLARRWRGATAEPEARGWLVRGANVNGRNLVPDWLAGGYCSIAYPELARVAAGLTRSQLDVRLAEVRPDLSTRQRSIHVGVLHRFLNEIQPGDLVATVDGPNVYVGRITGPPEFGEPAVLSTHRRAVRWANADAPFSRKDLADSAQDRLSGQMTVSSLGPEAAEFATLAGLDAGADLAAPGEPPVPVEAPQPVELPDPTPELAKSLYIDLNWLADTVDLLREKKQLILYGPPGTGKTYLAQEMARFLTEQTGGDYRLVQFHPSYSYEDFVEGFRPQAGATPGTVAFGLEPGPFKQLVQDAAENISRAYVLVVDEINRANLAKVFGELYFLLEYRDRVISLQYSPTEEFRLPQNVYLIGTMNTADRSIARVDAAMRRRFAWQGLFPGEPPVDAMLRDWLAAERLPADRASLLDALNARLGDRDAAIGPAYLMTRRVGTPDGLARVWRHHILPLLEERYSGEPGADIHERFGLESLLDEIGVASETANAEPAGEDGRAEP